MATFIFTDENGMPLQGFSASSINAYGMTGLVTNVSLTLLGLSHRFPDDLDMLLVAPDELHNLAFWSDAGGDTDMSKCLTEKEVG